MPRIERVPGRLRIADDSAPGLVVDRRLVGFKRAGLAAFAFDPARSGSSRGKSKDARSRDPKQPIKQNVAGCRSPAYGL